MPRTKFNREQLKEAFLALDATKTKAVLVDAAAPDAQHAEACVDEFRRSGCAVVRHQAARKLAARDVVAGIVRLYLNAFPDLTLDFESHLEKARLVETSFHDILATIAQFEIAESPRTCGPGPAFILLPKNWRVPSESTKRNGRLEISSPCLTGHQSIPSPDGP
jgi:hypothetical protein